VFSFVFNPVNKPTNQSITFLKNVAAAKLAAVYRLVQLVAVIN
jgi:hypothetical protein